MGRHRNAIERGPFAQTRERGLIFSLYVGRTLCIGFNESQGATASADPNLSSPTGALHKGCV